MGHNNDLSNAPETLSLLKDETALLISELEDPQIIGALEREMRSPGKRV